LSNQVPPTPEDCSKMTTSALVRARSLTAAAIPPKPAPITATLIFRTPRL
jgi:hypothetical protein